MAAGLLAVGSPAGAQGGAGAVHPALARATFDTAWTTIGRAHYDTTFNGVDWNAVRAELRPRAEGARSREELREVLREMLGRLRQSHFALIPGDAYAAVRSLSDPVEGASGGGEVGVEVRLVGEEFRVTRVLPGGPAERAGVRMGWAVDSVGTLSAAEVVAALRRLPADVGTGRRAREGLQVLSAHLGGPPGAAVRVRFRDGRGRPVAREMVRAPGRGEAVVVPGFPPIPAWLEPARVRTPEGSEVGVIRFNVWAAALMPELDRAVDALRDADGMVIDLRGNPGGAAFMPSGVAGHFFDAPEVLGVMRTRQGELRVAANPRLVGPSGGIVKPFSGPVAILLDALSASASEVFAGGMQGAGRARVFGERSAGAVLPSTVRHLPNGDLMQYVTGDFATPAGRRFEGVGVVPDVPAPPTREALLEGRDPALEAALRWISEQKRAAGSTR